MIPYKDLLAYDINRKEQENISLAGKCLYAAATAIQHAADKEYKEAAYKTCELFKAVRILKNSTREVNAVKTTCWNGGVDARPIYTV